MMYREAGDEAALDFDSIMGGTQNKGLLSRPVRQFFHWREPGGETGSDRANNYRRPHGAARCDPRGEEKLLNRFDKTFWKRANEQTSIPESNRISGASADFATPSVGKYEFTPAPSFRSHVAIEVGVGATR
jgi:hypothetical protein